MTSVFRRRGAWRSHPLFVSSLADTFPGLGRAAKVFLAFVIGSCVFRYLRYYKLTISTVDETYKLTNKPVKTVPDLTHYEYVKQDEQMPPRLVIHKH
jgi:hypothetical protein